MNYTYTVPEGIRYLRADKALALAFPDHSRTALQRAFDSGLVTLRGAAIKRDQSVTALDTLEFAMPDIKAVWWPPWVGQRTAGRRSCAPWTSRSM